MKMIVIGCVALLACGALWLGVSGGLRGGTAQTGAAFDYELATLEARDAWLRRQADPTARRLHSSLGGDMKVAGWAVDARRRQIDLFVQVSEQFQPDDQGREEARRAMIAEVCPAYSGSPLGANGVMLRHRFMTPKGREALMVAISPIVCRAAL